MCSDKFVYVSTYSTSQHQQSELAQALSVCLCWVFKWCSMAPPMCPCGLHQCTQLRTDAMLATWAHRKGECWYQEPAEGRLRSVFLPPPSHSPIRRYNMVRYFL